MTLFRQTQSINGDVLEDANPAFNNFFYHYKVQSTRLSVKGKILKQTANSFMPYISTGLEVAFNRAHSFTAIPKIFEEIPAPPFQDHRKNTFTYSLGIGVQKILNLHWQTSVGYEFSDFGKANLARANGQTLNSGLSLNHIYTHSALLSLTYIA